MISAPTIGEVTGWLTRNRIDRLYRVVGGNVEKRERKMEEIKNEKGSGYESDTIQDKEHPQSAIRLYRKDLTPATPTWDDIRYCTNIGNHDYTKTFYL